VPREIKNRPGTLKIVRGEHGSRLVW
jgi:hypothetical protein